MDRFGDRRLFAAQFVGYTQPRSVALDTLADSAYYGEPQSQTLTPQEWLEQAQVAAHRALLCLSGVIRAARGA